MDSERQATKLVQYGALGTVTLTLLSLFIWAGKVVSDRAIQHMDRADAQQAKTAEVLTELLEQVRIVRQEAVEAHREMLARRIR